jgi:hypothetical protein
MKKIISSCLVVGIIILFVFLINYLSLGRFMSNTISEDHRNMGLSISAHYEYYLNPNVLIINVKKVSGSNAPADVFRVLLQFAEKMQKSKYEYVHLQSKGNFKYMVTGEYFSTLGREYSFQNAAYTIRTFPENVYLKNGEKAFSSWSGGIIGVMKEQMEDFNRFTTKWFGEDY